MEVLQSNNGFKVIKDGMIVAFFDKKPTKSQLSKIGEGSGEKD